MDRLILDIGALIALKRGYADRPDVLPGDADVAVSAITASELLVGAELADADHKQPRHELVQGVMEHVEVIPFDVEIAHHHASLLAHVRRAG